MLQKFKNKTHLNLTNYEPHILKDITDGSIYQNFLADQKNRRPEEIYTFLLNSDGIKVCNKSELSIWPVYLAINEIPLQYRFCVDNVIVAGLSVAYSKPKMNTFLKPIIQELMKYEYGIDVSIDKNIKDIAYFYTLHAVFDKPARADILNIKNANGSYGCLKCLQPGETLKLKKSSSNLLLH